MGDKPNLFFRRLGQLGILICNLANKEEHGLVAPVEHEVTAILLDRIRVRASDCSEL